MSEPKPPTPDLDLQTGMPIVPHTYFWRVSSYQDHYDYWPTLVVQLRRHAPRWLRPKRTEVVAERSALAQDSNEGVWLDGRRRPQSSNPEHIPEHTLALATLVYQDQKTMLDQTARRNALDASIKAVTGDYPPKALTL